jgi:3-hydroxyacyl-CoA dehydrogenase
MVEANGSDGRATAAVLGAGIMGSAMTRNLVAAGVHTRVWDGSPAATAPLAAAGAVAAASARVAVQDAAGQSYTARRHGYSLRRRRTRRS